MSCFVFLMQFVSIMDMKKILEKIHHYDTVFDPNGDGYTVTVSQLPGLVTEGSNLKEAREMAKDAIRCYLEAVLKEKSIFPQPQRREKIRVTV